MGAFIAKLLAGSFFKGVGKFFNGLYGLIKPHMKWILLFGLAVVWSVFCFNYGKNQTLNKMASNSANKSAKQATIQTEVAEKNKAEKEYITQIQYVNKEVIKYVPGIQVVDCQIDPAYTEQLIAKAYIPQGTINYLNSAAQGKAATKKQVSDLTDSGVSLPNMAEVVATDWLPELFKARADIRTWEEWYIKSYKNWADTNKVPLDSGEHPIDNGLLNASEAK